MSTESAPRVEPARSTVVVVLGACRSGTSLLTRGIQALGVDLGNRLPPGSGKNPTGFFEDRDLLALNQRLKRLLGVRDHSLRLIESEEWQAPAVQALQQEAVATVRRRFGPASLWGFKYSRTLRFLPFWTGVFRELGLEPRYVVALRNPLSVARSRVQLHPERGRPTWTGLEWLVNVVPYFRELRGHPLAVVDFDTLVDEPAVQLQRVAAGLHLPYGDTERATVGEFGDAFLRKGMRHSRFGLEDLRAEPALPPLVTETYSWLYRLAHDRINVADDILWHDWHRMEIQLRELAPLLREMDWLRGQLESARRNPFSSWLTLRQLWRDWRSR